MQSQFIIETLAPFVSEERKARIQQVLAQRTQHITLALDSVYHTHNISACLRSADAFGIQDVHIIKSAHDRPNEQIALGSEQWLSIFNYSSAQDCLDMLRSNAYRIVASSLDPTAIPLHELNLGQPTAIFFGAEKEGVSDSILEQADEHFHIPMMGFTQSLNISVACAISLQYLRHQLGHQYSEKAALPLEEQNRLTAQWYKQSVRNADMILNRADSGSAPTADKKE